MIELLSPAGDMNGLIASVRSGADAVYLGLTALNARQGAANFDAQALLKATAFCHERGVRVYVTINTLVMERETGELCRMAQTVADAGADGLIVQDLGAALLLRQMDFGIEIHASTQMSLNNAHGLRFAREMGISRVVLAREVFEAQLPELCAQGVEIEMFAHGALCVCFSGQCLFSSMVGGRSGNRGACAQPCRLAYTLGGQTQSRYRLSPKDLCMLAKLPSLYRAGVRALKIEGRARRPEYAAVATYAYRRALDAALEGKTPDIEGIWEELRQIYNRGGFMQGYCPGFTDRDMLSMDRPNHEGVEVGAALAGGIRLSRDVDAKDTLLLRAGKAGTEEIPVQGISGHAGDLVPAPVKAEAGARLMRLHSEAQLSGARARVAKESILVPLSARMAFEIGRPMELTLSDGADAVSVRGEVPKPATGGGLGRERIAQALQKTGDSLYRLSEIEFEGFSAQPAFVPVSAINQMRRDALSRMAEARIQRRRGCRETVAPIPQRIPDGGEESGLSVFSPSLQDWEMALSSGADRFVWQPQGITGALLPALWERARPGRPIWMEIPSFVCDRDLEALHRFVCGHAPHIEGVVLTNPGQLVLDWAGAAKVAGMQMNITNSYTVDVLKGFGVSGFTASAELSGPQITQLSQMHRGMEMVVSGRIPLMTLRQCPLSAENGTVHDRCRICRDDQHLIGRELSDQKGYAFPLARYRGEEGCVVRVLNSVPLFLLKRHLKLPRVRWQMFFTDESPEMKQTLLALTLRALSGEDPKNHPLWERVAELPFTGGYVFQKKKKPAERK